MKDRYIKLHFFEFSHFIVLTSSIISDDVIVQQPCDSYQNIAKGSKFVCTKFHPFWVNTADSAINHVTAGI